MKLLIVGCILAASSAVVTIPENTDSVLHDRAAEVLCRIQEKPKFLNKAIDWLAAAQYESGGWGAGQHTRQQVMDPRAVQIDPATTAFSALALMRAGSSLHSGPYRANVTKALDCILTMIEESGPNDQSITTIRGTQPQRKLGQNIDVAMASQFLTKIRSEVRDDKLGDRIDRAIETCITKIEEAQNANGSAGDGGWAPVLQSAMAVNALELAEVRGYQVDGVKMAQAKRYQQENVVIGAGASDAAGIPLYALSSAQRATASDARYVEQLVPQQMLEEEDMEQLNEVVVSQLVKNGKGKKEAKDLADAYVTSRKTSAQLEDDAVWRGFGNNGGEEFLSYMMTSESMVQKGPNDWDKWYGKISQNFEAIQNGNGSWSGHHCITSPVFCTAAVILSLTAGDDPDLIGTTNGK